MAHSPDWNTLTDTPLQADLMRRLSRLYQTSKLTRDGQRWTAPKVVWLAEQIGVHHTTISRALKALADRGLILLRRWRWHRSPRLYIKVLVKARTRTHTETHTPRTLTDTQNAHCSLNTGNQITPSGNTGADAPDCERDASGEALPEKAPNPPTPLPPISKTTPDRRTGKKLGGTVAGAQARAEARQASGAPEPGKTGKRELALRWRGLLRAYDGNVIDVDDPKTLRHVGLVIDRLRQRGFDPWHDLPKVIDAWTHYAPKNAGKTPYPWAVLRAMDEFAAYRKAITTPAKADPKPAPAPVHPSAPPPPPPPPSKSSGGFLDKFAWAKKKSHAEPNAPKDALSIQKPVVQGGTTDETFKEDGE